MGQIRQIRQDPVLLRPRESKAWFTLGLSERIGDTTGSAQPEAVQATVAPRNWQEMFNALHRKIEGFAGRLRAEALRHTAHEEHAQVIDSRLSTFNSNCERFEAGLRAIRSQIRNMPGGFWWGFCR